MRVLPLTDATERKVLASRRASSRDAERVAARIVEDVRRRGDAALFSWTKRLDRVALSPRNVWVTRAEMLAARAKTSRANFSLPSTMPRAISAPSLAARSRRNGRSRSSPECAPASACAPIESVGCYLPGGRFSLVSTLLMTVIPAQEAGVREIVVASPQPGPALLAAAEKLGVRRVARVGGAQAIAALAYGTRSIPRVDKIFGPGNRFVTAAKKLVSNDCAIDMLAGPTEALVFATARKRAIHRRGPDRAGGARSRRNFDFGDHLRASGPRRRRRNRKPAGESAENESGAALAREEMAQCWLRKISRRPRAS